MTIEELRAAVAWISASIRSIHDTAVARGADLTDASERAAAESLTDDEQTRWTEGVAEVARLNALIARHEEVSRMITDGRAAIESGDGATGAPAMIVRTSESDLYNLDGIAYGDDQAIRDRALEVIERTTIGGGQDHHRENAEHLARSLNPSLAARIVLTSAPAYRSAFIKNIAGRQLNEAERVAVERAVTLGAGTADFAVPAMLDTTIVDTGTHSSNPFRQVATIKQITGSSWKGVSSAGVTASWDGEGVEVSDDAPTLAALDIPVFKGAAFVPFSIESEDWVSIEADVRSMIQVAKDDLEGAAFVAGNGTSAPQGVTTALDGTSSEIAPTTAETFARADITKLMAALPARFRSNAAFIANMIWYNGIKAFETTIPVGSLVQHAPAGAGNMFTLEGYPAYESSDMDAVLPNAAATADNFGLLFGDWKQAYYIVDRVGLTVEFIPHLFDTANNRPSGMRGFYAYWRTGAEVVNASAAVMLSIPTAA